MPTLVLHNIRSAHNVGSMFRTADAVGVGKVILSGYTPGPIDPHGKERKPFVKVSLGAEKMVPWERSTTLSAILKKLKAQGYTIVAAELTDTAVDIFKYKAPKGAKLAVVMGNEVRGINKQNLKYCDTVVAIPMRGKKESLNVGVAAGVALYTLLR